MYYGINEAQKHYTKQKKPNTKATCCMIPFIHKRPSIETKIGDFLGLWEQGLTVNDHELFYRGARNVLKRDYDDGCTTR